MPNNFENSNSPRAYRSPAQLKWRSWLELGFDTMLLSHLVPDLGGFTLVDQIFPLVPTNAWALLFKYHEPAQDITAMCFTSTYLRA